jgi:uncharacterized protein (TIGR02145 family)
LSLLFCGCGKKSGQESAPSVAEPPAAAVGSDNVLADARDGKKYKTVKIGGKTWMAENLNYEAEGSRCYNDSASYCGKYGRLYNWETAMKSCPKGWRLSTDADWRSLADSSGGDEIAGKKLKSTSGWNNKDDGSSGNGTDEYGFSALPGGDFTPWCVECGDDCCYQHIYESAGVTGSWWSATEKYAIWGMGALGAGIGRRVGGFNPNTGGDGSDDLYSVRCVKE